MNFTKTLQTLGVLACMLFSLQTSAQWTSCNATAGLLNGSTNGIYMTDTTPVPVFVTSPSPTGTIPNTEFLIILQDSMAADTLGDAIIATSVTGQVNPADLGLAIGDTFTIVPISYSLTQIRSVVSGIFNNSVPFLGSCCNIVNSQGPPNGVCDTLKNIFNNNANNITNAGDLLLVVSAFSGGGSASLRGLKAVLAGINDQLGTLSSLGCTNGVSTICYAMDSLASNHTHYAVTTMVNTWDIESASTLQIAVSPNPFIDQIATGIRSEIGGEHVIRVFDATGRTVHQEVQQLAAGEQTIWLNLGNLSSGMYYLQVSDSKNIATQKIVKR